MYSWIKTRAWLIGIMIAAVFFRFWQISSLPAGLFPDEAANGLDVNSILTGDIQPFYERGNGREALFFYMLSLSVSLFGRGVWQHHIVSAAIGVAVVLVSYYLTRKLFGHRVALLAAFITAVSSFAVTITRTAFRANLVPLFSTLTLLFTIKAFTDHEEKSRLRSAVIGGIAFGLTFYSYISSRMLIPLFIFFICLVLLATRGRWKDYYHQHKKQIFAYKLSFLATIAWIGYYYFTHPGSFIGRAGQVSIFSPDLNQGDVFGTFLKVLKLTFLGFFTEGDLNWRHNVSGQPFLSPLVSPFFALALVVFTWAILRAIRQAWRKTLNWPVFAQALVGGWFWVMVVPEVTTAEGIPHGLRLIGVIPPIFIMAAWGIHRTHVYLSQHTVIKNLEKTLAILFLAAVFIYNFYLYFGIAAGSTEYYYQFRSDLTAVSRYLNERDNKLQTYLVLDKFSVQTVDYLTTEKNRPYKLLDIYGNMDYSPAPGDQIVFTQSTLTYAESFETKYPELRLIRQEKNKFNQIIMLVYEKP